MKRIIYLLSLVLFACSSLRAADMEQANQLYQSGEYAQAALVYEQLLTAEDLLPDGDRAELLYNLGNARFKQGELAQSILAYERSLRLNPKNKDCRHNLQFAESRITDRIEDRSAFFISTWAQTLRNRLSESTWIVLSLTCWILLLAAVFGFLLGSTAVLRKSSFYIGITTLVVALAAAANAGSLHHRDTARTEAIITQGIVNAKSSPDRSGTDLFTLHEGTKVTIHETIGDWGNIHVGNNVGWIRLNTLERI